ncbi:hypothetical protein HYN56_12650 [Flavobacterium crocinum]|uniref:Uncharacterized protein n=1 Tax=Flavobacterium crocinum TaxID=2183896 RepID=A0A2S1YLT8_9FLAO|nr:hypothetical protein [Flavobacterium crocinum]AWK05031.1 hypothetical protein HYN56_12650 [Flavobacterium crocinum]
MQIKIFFSWQLSTEAKYNKDFILTCLHEAVNELEHRENLKSINYIIQEGTRGLSGSPSIPNKIMDERIPNCDIFIADLSIVNHTSCFIKFLKKTFENQKYKPAHNDNVLIEYGIAYDAVGPERIIGILNSFYGSPSKDNSNVTFDIRHLRFPIEYTYNKKSKNSDDIKSQLVKTIVSKIEETTLYILKNQKEKYRPFKNWNDWNLEFDSSQRFHQNDYINKLKTIIVNSIKQKKETIRLIGLSGLGKTRILFEMFRPVEENHESLILSSRVLYYDFKEKSSLDLTQYVINLQSNNEDKIIILDNCEISNHRILLNLLKKSNNNLFLITIDSNPEELESGKHSSINYLHLQQENLTDVVTEIIEEDFSYLSKDNTEKIKEFSQGIPLMVKLLTDSDREGNPITGKLDDKELLDRLLGEKGNDSENRNILRSCSLFNHIGFEDEVRKELEYIAKNKDLTSVDIQDNSVLITKFTETCNHFLKREIFERRGRYISMRPFPFAMQLATEWLETCSPQKMSDIITYLSSIEEDEHKKSISDSFAKRMKYLNFNTKAVEITDKLVSEFGPFYNAKVLNTELGSRLFRSFVEVNPVATSNTLWNIFSEMQRSELLKIEEGRRNLVWSLGKLCFDKRTFKQSTKTLFLFALAENESWSNNSTGEFIHLFKILLPGTSANLKDRFYVLKWAFDFEDKNSKKIAFAAIKSALDSSHFSRIMGAEEQGKIKLKDYEPSNQEIYIYWQEILDLIIEPIHNNDWISEKCISIILESSRSLVRFGCFNILKRYLETIFEIKKWDFDQGLLALKQIRKYDIQYLINDDLDKINFYITKLSKNDFKSRFINAHNHFYLDIDFRSDSFNKYIEYFENLANEFLKNNYSWNVYLPVFYSSKPDYTFYFGRKLFELLESNQKIEFVDLSLDSLEKTVSEQRNYSLFEGFISGNSIAEKRTIYEKIFQNYSLQKSLFYFISHDSDGHNYFDYLLNLIDHDEQMIYELYKYTYNQALSTAPIEVKLKFYKNLLVKNKKSYSFIIESIFSNVYNSENPEPELLNYSKKLIIEFGTELNFSDYKISQLLIKILDIENQPDLARFINATIISSISWERSYHLDNEVQKIYNVLIVKYFDFIWNDLSKSLIATDENYNKFYGLKHILGSYIGGVGRKTGLLFSGKIDVIFDWAEEKRNIAPERLAQLIPIYADNNTNYNTLNPLAIKLLDNFGDIEEVIRSFSANMGSYSWTGSIIPLLEAKKEIFKFLSNHKFETVRSWANARLNYIDKEIENEKNREDEMYL